MTDQLIVERGGLAKKDKSELQAIVQALGGTSSSRARKADLIDQILELSGAAIPAADDAEAKDGAADDSDGDGSAANESTSTDGNSTEGDANRGFPRQGHRR